MRAGRLFIGMLVGGLAGVSCFTSVVSARTPSVVIYGDLAEICFESPLGASSLVTITLENRSDHTVVLRDVEPVSTVNAAVDDIAALRPDSPWQTFGFGAVPTMTPTQRNQWQQREAVEGFALHAGETAELLLTLSPLRPGLYAGIDGLWIKYDDGWFSATTSNQGVAGVVPPSGRCSAVDPTP